MKGANTLAEKVSKPLRRRPRERELRGCGCNGVNTLDAGQSEHQQQNNECFFGAFGKQPRTNAQQCPSGKTPRTVTAGHLFFINSLQSVRHARIKGPSPCSPSTSKSRNPWGSRQSLLFACLLAYSGLVSSIFPLKLLKEAIYDSILSTTKPPESVRLGFSPTLLHSPCFVHIDPAQCHRCF